MAMMCLGSGQSEDSYGSYAGNDADAMPQAVHFPHTAGHEVNCLSLTVSFVYSILLFFNNSFSPYLACIEKSMILKVVFLLFFSLYSACIKMNMILVFGSFTSFFHSSAYMSERT